MLSDLLNNLLPNATPVEVALFAGVAFFGLLSTATVAFVVFQRFVLPVIGYAVTFFTWVAGRLIDLLLWVGGHTNKSQTTSTKRVGE